MNRRDAIERLALLTGGALSGSTVVGLMEGCTTEKSGSFAPQVLTDHQNKLTNQISELIIPETDTPGAKAAGVNQFIDHMLSDWNTKEERAFFLKGLDTIDQKSIDLHQQAFLDLARGQQVEMLKASEEEARSSTESDSALKPFFGMMKEFTIVGYYTSEVGATKELQTSIIPGYYDGCIPYAQVGSAWSNAATMG